MGALMRIRSILLIVGIVLMAAFVALNLEEFNRLSQLSLGFTSVQAPLAIVMLVGLVAVLVVFLLFSAYAKSAYLVENRRTARELNTQRELADKAETSRFTELQQYLATESQAVAEREAQDSQRLDERLALLQADLESRIEQSGNTLAAYIGELEDRLERASGKPVIEAETNRLR
jgi:ABC-type transport system involved in cytochrome c biogenesis permease subunit